MKNLYITFCIIFLSACSGGGQSASPASVGGFTPAVIKPIAPPEAVVSVPEENKVSVIYYSVTKTVAPISGWPTKALTYTGSCMIYLSKTYCWDDGVKTIPSWRSNNYTYEAESFDFWGVAGTDSTWGPCSGGCLGNLMVQPREIASSLALNISAEQVKEVFNLGTSNEVSCVESDAGLDCGTFKVTL